MPKKIEVAWLYHAPHELLARLFRVSPRCLCAWLQQRASVSKLSRIRWCAAGQRYGLSVDESEELLEALLFHHRQRREYQLAIDRMIEENAIAFTIGHFLNAKCMQLEMISGIGNGEFSTWFHSHGHTPSRTTMKMLAHALGLDEVDLQSALTERQQRMREQTIARDRLAEYLVELLSSA